ncbi:ABC transporter permease [Shouchella lehensis]|uniref:Transport permease protein n=1 Tax=Shouchella lehensis TaxID=300825 RepID=A0A4Y7WLL4_9BACI|nr:ABC transporter permease [Shouchella lehensis]MBG9783150.1 hypothetical protein [Shouchella lehensis]TES49485.1 ABC transporter permease [Shouchella lehensis]
MGRLLRLSYLAYVGTGVFGNLKNHILNKSIVPITQIIFFALVAYFFRDDSYVNYVLVGNVVFMLVLSNILGVVTSVARDREIGLMQFILISPIERYLFLLSKAFIHIFDGLFMSIIGFLFISFFWTINISSLEFIALLGLLLLLSISLSMMGVFLGVLTFIYKDTVSIANFSMLGLLFISGINFPTVQLPLVLDLLSYTTPLKYGVTLIRDFLDGAKFDVVNLIIMIIIGLFYFLLALIMMNMIERKLTSKTF